MGTINRRRLDEQDGVEWKACPLDSLSTSTMAPTVGGPNSVSQRTSINDGFLSQSLGPFGPVQTWAAAKPTTVVRGCGVSGCSDADLGQTPSPKIDSLTTTGPLKPSTWCLFPSSIPFVASSRPSTFMTMTVTRNHCNVASMSVKLDWPSITVVGAAMPPLGRTHDGCVETNPETYDYNAIPSVPSVIVRPDQSSTIAIPDHSTLWRRHRISLREHNQANLTRTTTNAAPADASVPSSTAISLPTIATHTEPQSHHPSQRHAILLPALLGAGFTAVLVLLIVVPKASIWRRRLASASARRQLRRRQREQELESLGLRIRSRDSGGDGAGGRFGGDNRNHEVTDDEAAACGRGSKAYRPAAVRSRLQERRSVSAPQLRRPIQRVTGSLGLGGYDGEGVSPGGGGSDSRASPPPPYEVAVSRGGFT